MVFLYDFYVAFCRESEKFWLLGLHGDARDSRAASQWAKIRKKVLFGESLVNYNIRFLMQWFQRARGNLLGKGKKFFKTFEESAN